MVRSQKVINLSHFRKDSDLLLRAFLFLEGEPLRASFTPITVQDLPDRCCKDTACPFAKEASSLSVGFPSSFLSKADWNINDNQVEIRISV
jgi:hypothetical protein